MNVTYRQGRKSDCREIAELDYIASGGAVEFLFHDLVPNLTALEVVSNGLEEDVYPHTFSSAIVAEHENRVIGMALSYPASYHCMTEELEQFVPENRLQHFSDFFSSRVEDSYLIDAISVLEKYRSRGIGNTLLENTRQKALDEGFKELSLIVFADNDNAIKFYSDNKFQIVKSIDLKPDRLIPHEGGCLLMKCSLSN